MQFNNLEKIFIDADQFDYEKSKNDDEFDIREINNNNTRYIITPEIDSSENALCKIYNPENLIKSRTEDPKNKVDQPWYSQLQILRESILLKRLDHPTIIKFVGLNLYNNKVYFGDQSSSSSDEDEMEEEEEEKREKKVETCPTLFLEYVGMKSIRDRIINKKLSTKFKSVKRQICIIGLTAAVRYLHHNNVAHRNLNPGSIWLDENNYPKIFDFSHSREFISDENEQKNVTNNGSNQFRYQAPEVFLKTIDYKFLNSLDIYSLGRLIYLMITGFEPFKHKDDEFYSKGDFKLQEAITRGSIPFFPDTVSEEWKEVLKTCWSLNPSLRPTADDIYHVVASEDFLIADFDKTERNEIIKYIKAIKEFEDKAKVKLTISKTVQDDDFIECETPKLIQDLFKELDELFEKNTVNQNEKRFLQLINELGKIEKFYVNNYLPKAMKYVDIYLDNNYAAKDFIKIAFGDDILPKNIQKITIGTVPLDIEVLNVPPTVTRICSTALSGYSQLKRVYIPDSVEIIEDGAFSECKELKYVRLPNSLKGSNLGKGVFKNCCKLNHIQIPDNLTEIKKETFAGNSGLSNLKLNKGLLKIGSQAFTECNLLESVKIPESVTSIGKDAFHPCKNLKTIEFKGVATRKIIFIKWGKKYSK